MANRKTIISSMTQSIYALKYKTYKGEPVKFAGGLTLNTCKWKE